MIRKSNIFFNLTLFSTEEKPVVECSFITEFEDHIFVTVDADTFFFLHDLITSYLSEKEKVIASQTARSASPNPTAAHFNHHTPHVVPERPQQQQQQQNASVTTTPHTGSTSNMSTSSHSSSTTDNSNPSSSKSDNKNSAINNGVPSTTASFREQTPSSTISDDGTTASTSTSTKTTNIDIETFLKDWRHFNCKTWHLEPTVRLHSFVVKSIEPYGIDYILNKLGFSHARTTIPKWLQRGFMDPLDKIEALLMIQLLSMARENSKQN